MWPWRHARRVARPEPPSPAPQPPRGEWRALAPIQRTVAAHPLVNPAERFRALLSAWQDPRFVSPLGHAVGDREPSGLIDLLSSPSGDSWYGRPAARGDGAPGAGPDTGSTLLSHSWSALAGTMQPASDPGEPGGAPDRPRDAAVTGEAVVPGDVHVPGEAAVDRSPPVVAMLGSLVPARVRLGSVAPARVRVGSLAPARVRVGSLAPARARRRYAGGGSAHAGGRTAGRSGAPARAWHADPARRESPTAASPTGGGSSAGASPGAVAPHPVSWPDAPSRPSADDPADEGQTLGASRSGAGDLPVVLVRPAADAATRSRHPAVSPPARLVGDRPPPLAIGVPTPLDGVQPGTTPTPRGGASVVVSRAAGPAIGAGAVRESAPTAEPTPSTGGRNAGRLTVAQRTTSSAPGLPIRAAAPMSLRRDPAPSAVPAAGPARGPASGGEPEELLATLYDPLLRRLKAELRIDRDRCGSLTDLRR